MVQRGEVALTDPVAKYLPSSVKVPERGGKSIRLVDLSTHTSGLPRLPTNFAPKDSSNPYVDYTVEQLYQFLSSYTLPRDIGTQYEYSNLMADYWGTRSRFMRVWIMRRFFGHVSSILWDWSAPASL